jgi:hypothetical protein
MSTESDDLSRQQAIPTRQPWEAMTLMYLGRIADVVQGGMGKISATGGDPGEPRKQRATG